MQPEERKGDCPYNRLNTSFRFRAQILSLPEGIVNFLGGLQS